MFSPICRRLYNAWHTIIASNVSQGFGEGSLPTHGSVSGYEDEGRYTGLTGKFSLANIQYGDESRVVYAGDR